MAKRALFLIASLVIAAGVFGTAASAQTGGSQAANRAVQDIVNQLENRYAGKNFSADFVQESTLTAMDITDTATGKAWFKHPGKMRWEYISPEEHAIITDGDHLWIYRPADNQVITGDAANYFGNGKGASFLSNFALVQDTFDISIQQETDSRIRLKLVPRDRQFDLAAIFLSVKKDTLDIEEVVSENVYGDTTKISFKNLRFSDQLDEGLFHFEIPPGADIVQMEE